MSKYYCPNCGYNFTKEEHRQTKKIYPMACLKCNKDFKSFEIENVVKIYKGYIFKKQYNQFVSDILGGFATFQEAKTYINNLQARQKQRGGGEKWTQ